ncbi:MAG: SAM-dependent methyltransferase [Bacteroidetes bacterium]|nr:SAM-dependent methyltransferase [Bacteroidota bacterium]
MATLYLIPTPLAKGVEHHGLPESTLSTIRSIQQFVVESQAMAQGFLQWVQHPTPDYQRTHRILNKKTPPEEIFSLMDLFNHGDVGYFSEAGAPAVADPGATLVRMAHDKGIHVVPLVGPSSILMALMASGMNGQSFTFHGYLPIDSSARKRALQDLEAASSKDSSTQLFIETPHRTEAMLLDCKAVCKGSTRLCVAASLTMSEERILSQPMEHWSAQEISSFSNQPAVFCIQAQS